MASAAFITQLVAGALSLFIVVYGAEVAVRKLVALAAYYDIPNVVIGLTVVSIGTSLPELSASTMASVGILTHSLNYNIASATVLGTNIGSDVIQQTLILGVTVLVGHRLVCDVKGFWRDYVPMIATAVLLLILSLDGVLTRLDGAILFFTYIGYLAYIYSKRGIRNEGDEDASTNPRRDAIILVVAMAGLLGAAQVLLGSINVLVEQTGLGGSFIGIITLGVASAMPELMTALAAVRHNAHSLSFGTLIGSNITNPLMAVGFGAMLSTYSVPHAVIIWDLPMNILTAALLIPYILKRDCLERGAAVYLICAYVVYIAVRAYFFSGV